MIREKLPLWKREEYVCPTPGPFIPFLMHYQSDNSGDNTARSSLLVIPGGAYVLPAAGEAEIVAKRFLREGFDVYVLTYTCALFEGRPVYLQPLKDLAKAVALIRTLHPGKLAICGFSAGGHLAGSLAVHWEDPSIAPSGLSDLKELRPDAEILCYPVISTGSYGHQGSVSSLFGPNPTEAELRYASLEKNVTGSTPPTFLWHTVTDGEVPVENSLLYAEALKKAGVSFELHLFPRGPHGYSLANEEWGNGEYGDLYVMEQFFSNMQYHIDHQIPLKTGQPLPPIGTDFRVSFEQMPKDYLKAEPNPAVAIWPALVLQWLADLGF